MLKKMLAVTLVLILALVGCGRNNETGDIDIKETAISFITDLSNEDYEKAIKDYSFDAQMRAVVNEDFLRDNLWEPLIITYGEYDKLEETTTGKHEEYDIIAVKVLFQNAAVTLNIVFDSKGLIAGINIGAVEDVSPEEASGNNFEETEVSFGKEGWKLPGTLTIPKGVENPPVLVLVHGSGPNDRDETIGPNKPFRDIAWGLAEKGIATLRYDKRTFVHTEKLSSMHNDFTVYDETIEDAVLAFQFLKTNDKIDNNQVFILGHSLGGMLIPRIASESVGAAGYIVMAGSVTPLEDLMVEQIEYLSELDGSISDEEDSLIDEYKEMRENVKTLDSDSEFNDSDLFGIPAYYWLDLKEYKPLETVEEIVKPVLFIQGDRDYQVPATEFEAWKNVVGNKDNTEFILYNGLNHLFMEGEGKSNPQEYLIKSHVSNDVIEDIANWILSYFHYPPLLSYVSCIS